VGCEQKSNESATASSSSPSEESTVAESNSNEGTPSDSAVIIVEGTLLNKIPIEMPSIGAVTFTESDRRSKALIQKNTGGSVSLSDDLGNSWTLTIPPYALHEDTEIELVAINTIACDATDAPFSGGIKLLPEGLTFIIPVNMSLKAADGALEPIPLMGEGSGAHMNFISYDDALHTMTFDHFSSLVFTDRGSLREATNLDALEKKVLSKAQSDINFVGKFLKDYKNQIEVPSPPVVSLACEDEDTEKKAAEQNKKFIEDAFEPEGLMIRMLISDLKGFESLQVDSSLKTEIYHSMNALYNRLSQKAIKLMEMYRGNPDYLVSVLQFATKVAKEADDANFFGGESPVGAVKLMERFPSFIESSLNPILDRLITEHDYRQAGVALKVASWVASLGDYDTTGIMEKVQAAMKFNLELSVKYTTNDTRYGVDATMPITFEYFSNTTGNYLHGKSSSVLNFSTSVPDTTLSANPQPISVLITEFDPCAGMGYFLMDPLFVSNEVMTIDGENNPLPIHKRWWEFAFEAYASYGGEQLEYMNGDTLYKFPFTINNQNVETFSESIDGQNNSKGKMTITFTYKLTHTPGN